MKRFAVGARAVLGVAAISRASRLLLFVAVFGFLAAAHSDAQQTPSLSADQLQQLQQMRAQQGGTSGTGQGVVPQETILEPNASPNQQLPTSRLEQILSGRAGVKLKQFGYDQLGIGQQISLPQMGAVQDNYILGPGDEIVVTLRGQENSEYRTQVDRDGMVTLPRLSPIAASGRSLADFQRDIVNAIHRAYVATEGYVTVGRLRQISVLVSGEVNSPGVRTLTGLSTAVDAILVSGGVKKTGSLRNVHILRGGHEISVDLYSILTGHAQSYRGPLADGDRIVVPPLGPTAAVTGWVRRPGIYEIAGGRSSMSVQELLALAGGLEVRGKYHISIQRGTPDGRNQMVALEGQSGVVQDSEIVFAQPAADQTIGQATLSGGTALAGQFSIKNTKLSDLLKSPGALGDNPYTLFGIISRRDPTTRLRTLVPFTPVAVLKGAEDMDIQSDDIVRVISADEARVLFSAVQQYNVQRQSSDEALRNPQASGAAPAASLSTATTSASAAISTTAQQAATVGGDRPSRQALAAASTAATAGQDGALPTVQTTTPNLEESSAEPGQTSTNREVTRVNDLASQLQIDPLILVNFLQDHSVNVDGAVRGPGLYLVGPSTDIQSLLLAAGGMARWADKSAIEVISTKVDSDTGTAQTERKTVSLAGGADASYIVSPRDEVRINNVYTDVDVGSVTVQGELRHVGTYQIVRGEHLSDLLIRAGGLTESAYPYGTVFLRRSAAAREQGAFRREAGEIEDQLMIAMGRRDPNSKLSPDAFTALQGYVNELKNQKALGRVAITADPALLAANPAIDPLLEAGDVIFVPQRPYSVSILGEVLQPGSVPFMPDMSASDYIDRVGGYSQFADKSETFIVLPDGSARHVERSWLDFGGDEIPPGSTIYVSRDISGLDLRQIIIDTTQIFSQLAVTAASLAVLAKQ